MTSLHTVPAYGLFVIGLLLIPSLILLLAAIRTLQWAEAAADDVSRIKLHLKSQKAILVRASPVPGSTGQGKRADRWFSIRYRDRNAWEHTALCRTSRRTGVQFSDDQVMPASGENPQA